MELSHVLLGLFAIFVIVTLARNANRTEEDKAKPSFLVRGWNSSGAPQVESTRVLPALRELAGRGAGHLTGRSTQAVKNRWESGADRRQAKAEAQREVIAEIRDAAKAKALDNARRVSDAVTARWENHRPAWSRRNPEMASATAPDGTDWSSPWVPPAHSDEPSPGAWPEVTAAGACGGCGTEHTATVPAGQKATDVACDCGRTLYFYRRIEGDPEIPGGRPATVPNPNPAPEARPNLHLIPKEDTAMTTTTENTERTATEAPAINTPADWQATAARVANFQPEEDAELIDFMAREVAGMSAYAAAYEELFETCTREIGLDPRSVQALGEFGEKVVDVTKEMALAHQRFVQVYEEVLKMVADGTQMPHKGRFFSGNVAV